MFGNNNNVAEKFRLSNADFSSNNASSAASSPATGVPSFGGAAQPADPAPPQVSAFPAAGGFSFSDTPSASSSFSSSPSTSERMSGQASPKMLMVSQKNLQIKAEAALTNILVNTWGPHMLELFMKKFNSMPDQVKLLNDSQQLEQMMRSWIPGNIIYFKKNFKPIIHDIIHSFETYL